MSAMVLRLRAAIENEREDAEMISGGGYSPDIWEVEGSVGLLAHIVSKSRTNNEPREAAMREDDHPVAIVQLGRNEHRHIVNHDPDNTVTLADALLRILDIHKPYNMPDGETRCANCLPYAWPCQTLNELAAGYRIQP